ncbi:MAG: hypothetical protein U0871_15635 [Gemmataceae bacterium]
MHHRPFPPVGPRRPAPATDWPDPPAIGRYAMPAGGPASAAVVRFIGQVFILSTAGLLLVQALRWVWPAGGLVLFGASSAALLFAAGLKWLWGDRVGRFPALTAAAIVGGLVWAAGVLGGSADFAAAALAGVGVMLLIPLVFAARWADAVVMWHDWKGTLTLAVAAAALLLAGLVPTTFTAVRVLFPAAMIALTATAFGVFVTYGDYLLANPAQPHAVIEEAAARWRRVVRGYGAGLGVSIAFVIGMAVAAPEPTAESAAAVDQAVSPPAGGHRPLWVWLAAGGAAVSLASAAYHLVAGGPTCWRAVLVWAAYGAGEGAVPGIHRPAGWLGSPRERQAALAGTLALTVLACRVTFPLDLLLAASVGRHPASPEYEAALRAGWAILAGSLVAPLALPVYLWPMLFAAELRKLHAEVEAAPPADLYPDPPAHTLRALR